MNAIIRWFSLGLLALMTPYPGFAADTSITDLVNAGRLYINSTVTPESNIVAGQRVRLTLEIGTDTWFTAGTRIGIPEVPGLVILQTEQFAANASETRDGTSWVIQRWTLDVFPQRAGEFTIEAIPVEVQVNAGSSADARGTLESPVAHFDVSVPEALATAEHWVASPEFTVSQQFDRPLEGLVAGDAFEQEVLFEASDVLAMMLPAFEVKPQEGLAAYPAPPVLDNNSNRGQTRATRSIRISYVVEQPGQYRLQARDYFWWNTQRGELQLLTLPETRIEVAGASTSKLSRELNMRRILLYSGGLLVLVTVSVLVVKVLPRLPWRRLVTLRASITRRWRALRAPALASRLNPDR